MKTKRIALILTLSVQIICASAQLSKTYNIDKPGTMISLMTEQEANQITNLTLSGNINAEDFRHLRDEFKNLKVLDLSNANIHLYAGKKGTYPNQKFYLYMKNFIPAYAFCRVVNGVPQGKESLEKVILSSKTINIEDCAFKGCNN
ncbi:MAG: leucine-rich repeat domain-containing protein, partial [Bacteroidaceae bacterium]|nr:leucine-rich repeat domain-containing protein [Bacteroidaceae bacterium]